MNTFNYLFSGVTMGLSAGLSPGPLLALVISETLRHGVRSGVKVALAPLLTDLPIVAVSLALLARLADAEPLLGAVSLLGAGFLAWLGYESLRFRGLEGAAEGGRAPQSIRKGVLANLLNPSPYLFWLSVGGPLVVGAFETGLPTVSAFVGAFYLCLVGSKIALAFVAARSGKFLRGGAYVLSVRLLGVLLLGFMGVFFSNGLALLGVR